MSPEAWELLEGNLFGASLFPYLAFLYFLDRDECAIPPRAMFGFKFLLVFVFGTIPGAIYAKVAYDDILANVDWLHGPAESLLTMTNLLIVVGMREGLRERRAHGDGGDGDGDGGGETRRRRPTVDGSSVGGALLGWIAVASVGSVALVGGVDAARALGTDGANAIAEAASFWRHAEPSNALSLPTWVIHVSSLIEWLVAMGLIWEYADVSGKRAYKGLTWGMIPGHASGIAACTFHLFYNAPVLSAVVATQAGLTVFGNVTLAIAAYHIAVEGGATGLLPWENGFVSPWRSRGEEGGDEKDATGAGAGAGAGAASGSTVEPRVGDADASGVDVRSQGVSGGMVGWENLGALWAKDSDAVLIAKLFVVSTAFSAAVKWGSLEVDLPFEPNIWIAFAIVFGPTLLNCAKWQKISAEEDEVDGGLATSLDESEN